MIIVLLATWTFVGLFIDPPSRSMDMKYEYYTVSSLVVQLVRAPSEMLLFMCSKLFKVIKHVWNKRVFRKVRSE